MAPELLPGIAVAVSRHERPCAKSPQPCTCLVRRLAVPCPASSATGPAALRWVFVPPQEPISPTLEQVGLWADRALPRGRRGRGPALPRWKRGDRRRQPAHRYRSADAAEAKTQASADVHQCPSPRAPRSELSRCIAARVEGVLTARLPLCRHQKSQPCAELGLPRPRATGKPKHPLQPLSPLANA